MCSNPPAPIVDAIIHPCIMDLGYLFLLNKTQFYNTDEVVN